MGSWWLTLLSFHDVFLTSGIFVLTLMFGFIIVFVEVGKTKRKEMHALFFFSSVLRNPFNKTPFVFLC